MPGAFKIVPGLGDALHEAMRKISGVEEIAPAAEGLAIFIIILLFWDWMPRVSLLQKLVDPQNCGALQCLQLTVIASCKM